MTRFSLAAVIVLASTTVVSPGSPVLANDSPMCSISPSHVSAVIDPAFFAAESLPDVESEQTQALFHPVTVALDVTPDYVWARTSLTMRGTTYRDTVGFPTQLFFPAFSGPYPSAVGWATAYFGAGQILFDFQKPFEGVYSWASLEDAFMDPLSYPITIEVEYFAGSGGEELCSLAFTFDVRRGNRGSSIDLDHYLDRATEADDALPDTV